MQFGVGNRGTIPMTCMGLTQLGLGNLSVRSPRLNLESSGQSGQMTEGTVRLAHEGTRSRDTGTAPEKTTRSGRTSLLLVIGRLGTLVLAKDQAA